MKGLTSRSSTTFTPFSRHTIIASLSQNCIPAKP